MDFAEQNPRAGTLARPYDYFIDTLEPPPLTGGGFFRNRHFNRSFPLSEAPKAVYNAIITQPRRVDLFGENRYNMLINRTGGVVI